MGNMMIYVRNIALFLVFMSFVENMLVLGNMKKYIRLFCGIVLVFIILQPVKDFLGIEELLSNSFNTNEIDAKLDAIEKNIIEKEGDISDKTIATYKNFIREDIDKISLKEGYRTDSVELEFDEENNIQVMHIYLKDTYSENNISKVKIDRITINKNSSEREEEGDISPEALVISEYVVNTYGVDSKSVKIHILKGEAREAEIG